MQQNPRSDRLWLAVVVLATAIVAADGAGAAEERVNWSKPTFTGSATGTELAGTGTRRWGTTVRDRGVTARLAHDEVRGVEVPVGRDVSFGLDYEYVTPEDLAFELAETGALTSDYESHAVMIRAAWRF